MGLTWRVPRRMRLIGPPPPPIQNPQTPSVVKYGIATAEGGLLADLAAGRIIGAESGLAGGGAGHRPVGQPQPARRQPLFLAGSKVQLRRALARREVDQVVIVEPDGGAVAAVGPGVYGDLLQAGAIDVDHIHGDAVVASSRQFVISAWGTLKLHKEPGCRGD